MQVIRILSNKILKKICCQGIPLTLLSPRYIDTLNSFAFFTPSNLKIAQTGFVSGKIFLVRLCCVTAENFPGSDKTDDTNKEIGFIISTDPNPKYGIIVGSKETIQKRRLVLETQK